MGVVLRHVLVSRVSERVHVRARQGIVRNSVIRGGQTTSSKATHSKGFFLIPLRRRYNYIQITGEEIASFFSRNRNCLLKFNRLRKLQGRQVVHHGAGGATRSHGVDTIARVNVHGQFMVVSHSFFQFSLRRLHYHFSRNRNAYDVQAKEASRSQASSVRGTSRYVTRSSLLLIVN